MVILGFSVDQAGPEVVRKFAAEQGVNYPLLMADDRVLQSFGMADGSPIPTTFLIDREGRVRHVQVGFAEAGEYGRIVAQLLQ